VQETGGVGKLGPKEFRGGEGDGGAVGENEERTFLYLGGKWGKQRPPGEVEDLKTT